MTLAALPVAACNGGDDMPEPSVDAGGTDGQTHHFQFKSADVTVQPGSTLHICYYFQLPNMTDVVVGKIQSKVQAEVPSIFHDATLYLTPTNFETPGTLTTTHCGIVHGGTGPTPLLVSRGSSSELTFPEDDGAGQAVGFPIKQQSPAFIEMVLINPGTTPQTGHIDFDVFTRPNSPAHPATLAGAYQTVQSRIDLLPGTPSSPASGFFGGTCAALATDPTGVRRHFFNFTMMTHRLGVRVRVADGTTIAADGKNVIFDGTDWNMPGNKTYQQYPYYEFGGSPANLTYQCDYSNPTNLRVMAGDEPTDEFCSMVAYYFPAPQNGQAGSFCLNSMLLY